MTLPLTALLITSLIVPGAFVLDVTPQPAGCRLCVTERPGEASLWQTPLEHGTIGLLAHDYLSGWLFYQIEPGDILILGEQPLFYQVTDIRAYKAVNPGKQSTDLFDATGVYSQVAIYQAVYGTSGRLVLQTCYGDGFWFVIALPVNPLEIPAKG